MLGRRVVRLPAGVLGRSMDLMFRFGLSDVDSVALDMLKEFPVADTTALREQWGFRTSWSMQDALRDTRRAIAGVNLLGTKQVRRRDAPVLPPIGGAAGDVARLSPAVLAAVHRELPADSALTADLLSRAAGGWQARPSHDTRRVAGWAATETSLLLGALPTDLSVETAAARLSQLGDLLVDLVALAQDEPAVITRVEAVAPALSGLVAAVGAGADLPSPWSAPLADVVHAARTCARAWN
jgi:hypothetical protein